MIRDYYRDQGARHDVAFRTFMCAPVAALSEQLSQLVFQDVLTLADQLYGLLDFENGRISLSDALSAYDQASASGILLDRHLRRRSRVVPEVAAEIASYAQSRSAREGVYALVDIGAGTLDLNVFKIWRKSPDDPMSTPIYAAACHPAGVQYLESLLITAAGRHGDDLRQLFPSQKSQMKFPYLKELNQRLAELSGGGAAQKRLQNAHAVYCSEVSHRTGITWGEAWKKRGINRDVWTSISLFICGGGAAISGIRDYLNAAMPPEIVKVVKPTTLPCPKTEEFVRPEGFPETEFHRVSVAYGLTFGSALEPYVLPKNIPILQSYRETIDLDDRFISKDMV